MKNISLILNIILLLAVAYLFADRFSGNDKPAEKEASTEKTGTTNASKIMYLNIDTLHANSKIFQKKKGELELQQAGAEATMRKKLKAFENQVIAFQKKQQSGTMTPKSAQEEGGRLAQKEQNLAAQQERLARDLLKATDEFNISFNGEVRDFLDSLKLANSYDYILIAGAGSQVLTANDELDLTGQVLEHLNKKEE